jgi:Ca2+:H+ antiporter
VFSTCHYYRGAEPYTLPHLTGATQLNSSLLTLSVIAVLLPAAFHSAVQPTISSDGIISDPLTDAQEGHDILAISHGASGFFLVRLSQLTTIQLGCDYPTLQ